MKTTPRPERHRVNYFCTNGCPNIEENIDRVHKKCKIPKCNGYLKVQCRKCSKVYSMGEKHEFKCPKGQIQPKTQNPLPQDVPRQIKIVKSPPMITKITKQTKTVKLPPISTLLNTSTQVYTPVYPKIREANAE